MRFGTEGTHVVHSARPCPMHWNEQLHGIGTKREFPSWNFEDEFAGVHTNLTKVTTADRLTSFVELFSPRP